MKALRDRLWTTPALYLLFLGGVALLFGIGMVQLPSATASLSWPMVEGLILSSEVYEACCGEYSEVSFLPDPGTAWYPGSREITLKRANIPKPEQVS